LKTLLRTCFSEPSLQTPLDKKYHTSCYCYDGVAHGGSEPRFETSGGRVRVPTRPQILDGVQNLPRQRSSPIKALPFPIGSHSVQRRTPNLSGGTNGTRASLDLENALSSFPSIAGAGLRHGAREPPRPFHAFALIAATRCLIDYVC